MSDLGLYEITRQEYVSALRAAVLHHSQYEVLPEVLEIMGEEGFLRFIEVFGGRGLHIPPQSDMHKVLRDISIWMGLSHPLEGERRRREERYVREFGIPRAKLWQTHEIMSRCMAGVGIALKPKTPGGKD
jgi:hypothetical protein